jgi:hypothetical protein
MDEFTITSAQYLFGRDGTTNVAVRATIDGVSVDVPMVNDNRHYQAILDWVADGNTIQDAD